MYLHLKAPPILLHVSAGIKQLVHRSGYDSPVLGIRWSHHCVGLATASLAIGKDADLVAVKCTLDKLRDLLKDFILQGESISSTIHLLASRAAFFLSKHYLQISMENVADKTSKTIIMKIDRTA